MSMRSALHGGVIAIRYAFGLVFLYGAYHKLTRQWLSSPVLREHFMQRLAEIDPESFSAAYLRNFAIPRYRQVAWVLTLGQVCVAIGMLFGVAVRPNALLALFLLSNITAGSYYNATMPPFFVAALILLSTPSGSWFGLDSVLREQFPESPLFR
ncbi:MAG: DoxX family membrane protein [Oscillochloris sp.]|nr:DoxX family membrane protein [Oscillochloris sp.]